MAFSVMPGCSCLSKGIKFMRWARRFRLVVIVVMSLFAGYLIGNFMPEAVTPKPPLASGFLVANLSIKPEEVRPNEIVNITVSVANTHDTWGIYSLVLNINGLKEAEKQAELDAGSSQDVSFYQTREDLGRYTVFINGLSGSFTVVQLPLLNWPLIGGIISAVIVVGLLIFFLVVRRRAT